MASSFSFERRMLKDFLVDHHELPSCSSKPCKFYVRARRCLSSSTQNKTPSQLLIRSRSKATSMINAIKFFPFTTMKAPAIYLPRSISRKLSRRNKEERENVVLDTVSVHEVKIKDILRWKSFRDVTMELAEEEKQLPTSMEFTVEDHLSSGCSTDQLDKDCMKENRALEFDKHYLQEAIEGTTTGIASKRKLQLDEDDQHSPVSVLNSPFQEDEEFFHRSLATVERRKCRLMQRIQEFESLANLELEHIKNPERGNHFPTHEEYEETASSINDSMHQKASQLLNHVKGKRSLKNVEATNFCNYDHLLMDFFTQELTIGSKSEQNDAKFDGEMLRLAESWLSKECNGSLDWEIVGKREECIRDMEKGLRWNSFEKEEQELGCKLEMELMNDLFDEILADLDP